MLKPNWHIILARWRVAAVFSEKYSQSPGFACAESEPHRSHLASIRFLARSDAAPGRAGSPSGGCPVGGRRA